MHRVSDEEKKAPHNYIARILVSANVRSFENQCPLGEGIVEFLQPPAQLGFFVIPIRVIL